MKAYLLDLSILFNEPRTVASTANGTALGAGHLLRGKGKAPALLLREPHTLAPRGHREHHHIPQRQLLAERWPRPHDERAPEQDTATLPPPRYSIL